MREQTASLKESDSSDEFNFLSPLQILYYSNLLALKKPKWDHSSTNQALIEAKIDPIPHQVEAAVFAFRNPLSGGVIIADEVGLGKTIETGLIVSQLWAEGKRNFLIISPKSLRHQWQEELKSLFYLDSKIIDTATYRKQQRSGVEAIEREENGIIITNEHFIDRYPEAVLKAKWDIIVIDEAHKLRNAWRPGKNQAKRAKNIREIIKPFKKVLLTATPMQNNLMELYGLVSFIDPHILGTRESFQRTFKNIPEEVREERIGELRHRMRSCFKRELRKNVSDYIKYTDRHALTIPYDPSEEEETLRTRFEDYLRKPDLIAIPAAASHLLRLVYFKLLASSSFALKNSLLNLYKRLMYQAAFIDDKDLFEKLHDNIIQALSLEDGRQSHELERFNKLLYKKIRKKSFEGIRASLVNDQALDDLIDEEPEVSENYSDEDLESSLETEKVSSRREDIESEAATVLDFILLSRRIVENKKAKALISTLKEQFKKAAEEGWPKKAVIFTEFRHTQDYVITALEEMGLNVHEDIVIFNGSSGDAESRKELVNEFRNNKTIFLTTEAGAEGLNLQFANLIINYDLPWNPQRIEQRIGRCHRYGQKLDVVVINFVNRKNIADVRVLELLDEKFNLFKSAFGASDEVLGQIESGTDIEKEIFKIYLNCRSEEEIKREFDKLIADNQEKLDAKMEQVREKILSDFDEEVQRKLKNTQNRVIESIGTIQSLVRDVFLSNTPRSEWVYKHGILEFSSNGTPRKYTFDRNSIGPAELIHSNSKIFSCMEIVSGVTGHVEFRYSGNHNVSSVAKEVGAKGQMALAKVSLEGIETEERLVPIFSTNDGRFFEEDVCEKLIPLTSMLTLSGSISERTITKSIERELNTRCESLSEEFNLHHEELYDEEVEKLECYYQDLQEYKKCQIADLDKEILELKKERRKLTFKAKRQVSEKIQKLKDKQIKLEEEMSALRQEARVEEKKRSKELHDQGDIRTKINWLFFGTFEIK